MKTEACFCEPGAPDHECGTGGYARITEPGIYADMPSSIYHGQRDWLSWSRMKHLIPPSTPAHFKAALSAGEERKRHFDLGKVVHKLTLGEGDDFVVVQALNRQKDPYDARDYDTVSAQVHRDAIYAEGMVPILAHELEQAEAMAEAVKAHPVAAALLPDRHPSRRRPRRQSAREPHLGDGAPEVSLFWIDPETGVKCRARLDWLPNPVKGRRLIVPDLKSTGITAGASPIEFSKAGGRLGYYGQQQHYSDGLVALGVDPDPAFLFIVVETAAPHLVSVGQYDDKDDLRLARQTVTHCRRLYRDCVAADNWPGYGADIHSLRLPTWLRYELEEIA